MFQAGGQDLSCALLLASSFAYILLALVIYPHHFNVLLVTTFRQSFGAVFLLMIIALSMRAIWLQPRAPFQMLVTIARKEWNLLLLGSLTFPIGLTTYTTFKINLPAIVPFYADPFIAQVDIFLHGRRPWDMVYLIPEQSASLIDFFYTRVWPGLLLAVYALAFVILRGPSLLRYLWSLLFVYLVLGGVVATVCASVGPIFYSDFYQGSADFLTLKERILGNPYIGDVAIYSRYLLENYRSADLAFGTGISAFPSVHVAVAVLTAWIFTSVSRALAVVGWFYAAVIEFGSIYTGWHYAVGGYTSAIAVSLFWLAISRFYQLPLMPQRRSAQRVDAASASA